MVDSFLGGWHTERPQNDTELVCAALGIQGPDGFVRSRDRKSKAGGGQLRKEGVRSAEEGAASWTDRSSPVVMTGDVPAGFC